MDKKKILVVEDEKAISDILVFNLQREGYDTLAAYDGAEGLRCALEEAPDLILLDVMMPRMDGFDVCRHIRSKSAVPIIMLTARGEENDELQGFSLGADEYIAKPFSLRILAARIEAVLRRGEAPSPEGAIRAADDLRVDTVAREVTVAGAPIELTYTEFELLVFLMQNAGIALSRDRILDSVWRYDYYGDARTVDTHIKKLRQKLGDCGNYIKTIRGIGYKFDTEK